MTVWAVVYGNYEPPEVLALYDNQEAAEDHAGAHNASGADELGYEVVPMAVRSTYQPP